MAPIAAALVTMVVIPVDHSLSFTIWELSLHALLVRTISSEVGSSQVCEYPVRHPPPRLSLQPFSFVVASPVPDVSPTPTEFLLGIHLRMGCSPPVHTALPLPVPPDATMCGVGLHHMPSL